MTDQQTDKLIITPDTKIAALLEAYPELEDKLIELAPEFKKLKNPLLRKTIARVASLSQAAQLGNISLGKLINELRVAVGQEHISLDDDQNVNGGSEVPDWYSEENIVKTLDARPMLKSGEHPVNIVMKEIGELQPGEIFELITAFLPAPLIDMAEKKGFHTWSSREDPELFKNFFVKI